MFSLLEIVVEETCAGPLAESLRRLEALGESIYEINGFAAVISHTTESCHGLS